MSMTPVAKVGFWACFLVLFIGFLWVFNGILTPFVLGIAIAYLLNPVMRRFALKKIPRWVSALFILTLFFSLIALASVLIGPLALRQAQMLMDQAPRYIDDAIAYAKPYLGWIRARAGDDYVEQLAGAMQDGAGKVVGVTGGILGGIATGGKFLMDFATTLILTPLVAFFMMKEWPHIVKWVESLYPRQHQALIRDLLRQIDGKVAGFIRGQITVAFMLGFLYAVALSIAGLKYGFLIGIGAGIFSIIPLVGSTLGLVVGVGVAWFQMHDLSYVAVIAGIFMGGQFVEGNILSPKVVGDKVGLHPLWIIFALMAGGSLFGIAGMLIAVPVAATIGVLAGFAVDQYKLSPLYQKEPEEPTIILEDHPHA